MNALDRRHVLALLAGTLFFFGLPQLYYGLTGNEHVVPVAYIQLVRISFAFGAISVLAGLLLLALTLLLRVTNPYRPFIMGALLAAGSLIWHLVLPQTVWICFVGTALLFVVLFSWPRPTGTGAPH